MNQLTAQLQKFNKYKFLLHELVTRDLKVKYRRSVLGYLWSLLSPLLMMLVISAVFSYMFRFDIPNYPIYLICGQVLFQFFSDATNMSMGAIIQNSALIKKVYVPKYIFPISRVLSCYVTLLFSLGAVLIVMIFTGTPFRWTLVFLPLPLIFIGLFAMGVGMLLSVVSVYFRDTLYLYGVLTTAWMYCTPIFYPLSSLPPTLQQLMQLNPLYHIITCLRMVVLDGTPPGWGLIGICLFWCAVSLAVGFAVFKRKQANFILHI